MISTAIVGSPPLPHKPHGESSCSNSSRPSFGHKKMNLSKSQTSVRQHIKSPSSLICCCGAKTWTTATAIIQILFAVLTIIAVFVRAPGEKEALPEPDELERLSILEKFKVLYGQFGSNLVLQLVSGIENLLLGGILLAGAQLGKPTLLVAWMIAVGLGLGLLFLMLIILLFVLVIGGGTFILLVIFLFLIPFLLGAFAFFVVAIHRGELVERENRSQPVVTLDSVHVDEQKLIH